jgi:hypothetical protein
VIGKQTGDGPLLCSVRVDCVDISKHLIVNPSCEYTYIRLLLERGMESKYGSFHATDIGRPRRFVLFLHNTFIGIARLISLFDDRELVAELNIASVLV